MQAGERVKQPGLANSFARFCGVGTEVPTPMLEGGERIKQPGLANSFARFCSVGTEVPTPMLAPIPEGGERVRNVK